MNAEQNSHNTVAYPGFPYPKTHPDSLAAMAILHGLNPAPVDGCRVLEIGCNEGANLIPMAYAIPTSEFVGFDVAGVPIERGQGRIRALGFDQRAPVSGGHARSGCRGTRRPKIGPVRLHHCAWLLRVGAGAGAGAHDGFDTASCWRRMGSRSSATTPSPAAICG